eukprot:3771114-Amphidinium_carterae.1
MDGLWREPPAYQTFSGRKGGSRHWLSDIAGEIVGDSDSIDTDSPLMDSGMDSLSSLDFRAKLSKEFSLQMPSTMVFEYPSISKLADFLVEAIEDAVSEGKLGAADVKRLISSQDGKINASRGIKATDIHCQLTLDHSGQAGTTDQFWSRSCLVSLRLEVFWNRFSNYEFGRFGHVGEVMCWLVTHCNAPITDRWSIADYSRIGKIRFGWTYDRKIG